MKWEKEFDDKMEHPMHQDTSSFTKAAMRLFIRQALESQMSDLRKEVDSLTRWGSADFGGMINKEDGGWIKRDEVLLLMKK